MLPGPQQGDYFDSIGRGFPTPNESSLRTGLTPGGGGSMFPAPSPNSQALFNHLQSGGATPGTLDFHRTAMNAAARSKSNSTFQHTSNPEDMPPNNSMDAQHDATDAANGLFMLAKGAQANNQFAVPNQAAQQARNGDARRGNGSTDMSANGDNIESPENSGRTSTRSTRGKKATKAEATPTNRRKSESNPKSSNKKSKGNSGAAIVDPALDPHDDDDSEDDDDMMPEKDTRKMTDEEKRRNFLERNRYVSCLSNSAHVTNYPKCRGIEVSTTEEAMAGEPPSKGRDVLCRE
jgi:ATF/CREB family transcription factor